jgi:ubiquinone/menaquinone biosynthesis C-methylase UbiE
MGFYEDRVLPHLVNVAMSTKGVRDERRRCLEHVSGDVLEIGFGTGLNLPFYPAGVTKVVGVDPSMTSARLARKRIAASSFPVEIVGLSAERLPVQDGSVTTVVSTFTLCTIPDVSQALRDVCRALVPGGRLHFVEHGRADDERVRRWQARLNGVQKKVFGGCHLDRPIGELIERAGLEIETLENDYLEGAPKFGGYLYRGVARRPIS